MVILAQAQLTQDQKQFLRYNSRDNEPDLPLMVVWMSEFGHNILRLTKMVGFDAQYTKSPRGFFQMFTVHALVDGRFLVVAFAWMSKKDEATYDRVFQQIFGLPSYLYQLEAFVSDFELSSTAALKSIFPEAEPVKCIFHLSQVIQKWARKNGLANFYCNEELKSWIILFSKLAYLPEKDVTLGFLALVEEYEGMLLKQITSWSDKPNRPVTNNAVESWNRQYKANFPGGGKPDRSKVIEFQIGEEEAVRHALIRHQALPEEEFRTVRPKQLESEQQIHALVSEWNNRNKRPGVIPSEEEIVDFLRSIQDSLYFASGQDPDTDIFDDEEDEENILFLLD